MWYLDVFSLSEKGVVVMDTPTSFIPHEHPLVDVECLDLLGHFSHLLSYYTGWCSTSVWETNLGLQVTKPILFSTACQSLQNCMPC
jgi:hypothetical protein